MEDARRVGTLEIAEDLDFQQRSWTAQRVGWLVMLLLIVAALAGLFGGGPLSQGTVGEQGTPLQVEYPRFARLRAPAELRVHIGSGAVSGNEARVWLDRTMLERVQVQQVTPEPDHVESGADRLTYVFQVSDPNQVTDVVFFIEPEQIGALPGRVGLEEGATLSFQPFVYP